ncbi:unnamed protein product [Ambrosiozyma monospora]|uniref:Unnamed protein product n=1 Tax=Ambrosiozyma monospora TaxID=43982 RepID=A0ACB5U6Q4_AMBMO|nr:unnamed protein product [Ambrosiozyma monospora]
MTAPIFGTSTSKPPSIPITSTPAPSTNTVKPLDLKSQSEKEATSNGKSTVFQKSNSEPTDISTTEKANTVPEISSSEPPKEIKVTKSRARKTAAKDTSADSKAGTTSAPKPRRGRGKSADTTETTETTGDAASTSTNGKKATPSTRNKRVTRRAPAKNTTSKDASNDTVTGAYNSITVHEVVDVDAMDIDSDDVSHASKQLTSSLEEAQRAS